MTYMDSFPVACASPPHPPTATSAASVHELPMIICLLTGLYYGGPLLALAALPVGSILTNLLLLIYMALVKL